MMKKKFRPKYKIHSVAAYWGLWNNDTGRMQHTTGYDTGDHPEGGEVHTQLLHRYRRALAMPSEKKHQD